MALSSQQIGDAPPAPAAMPAPLHQHEGPLCGLGIPGRDAGRHGGGAKPCTKRGAACDHGVPPHSAPLSSRATKYEEHLDRSLSANSCYFGTPLWQLIDECTSPACVRNVI